MVFVSYGMNDVINTNGDTDTFIKQYKELIAKIQKKYRITRFDKFNISGAAKCNSRETGIGKYFKIQRSITEDV